VPAALKTFSKIRILACVVCDQLEVKVARLEREYFSKVLIRKAKSKEPATSEARAKLNAAKSQLREHKRILHGLRERHKSGALPIFMDDLSRHNYSDQFGS
jgi:hypothetical protein